MPATPRPDAHIENHSLNNPCTSNWLRSCFELATRRDPVDAARDAELLAAAMQARCMDLFGDTAPLPGNLIAMLLQQHAGALEKLHESMGPGQVRDKLCALASQLDVLAAELATGAFAMHYGG